METNSAEKLKRAKKRVEELKGFYIHLTVYVIINSFILVNILISNHYNSGEFWRWENFVTLFFWGIGLAFHAAKVFGFNPLFSKDWEERQIQKFMERERREAEKFNR